MIGEIFLQTHEQPGWLHFRDPVEIVEARSIEDVLPQLQRLEAAVANRRMYAAGFIAYEAAPAFDPAMHVRPSESSLPLLWFGLYERMERRTLPLDGSARSCSSGEWSPTVSWPEYEQAVERIKTHLAGGDTYQINYTYRLRTSFSGDPWALFLQLAGRRRSGYAAYLDIGKHVICSASPELFFRLSGRDIVSKPMKGTKARGRTLAEDRANILWLRESGKNRAENVMIVDMLRNDLSRIAVDSSVDVPSLFEVERFPTVLQMTSTVTAKTDASLSVIMSHLFPCASITGAPKVRTMDLIAGLESTPRGIYTGCIGYYSHERAAQFNVAIRTVTIDKEGAAAEYGVGGGVVWDSDADDEYRECAIKAKVLNTSDPDFDLFESLLWTPQGYFLLDEHLARLADSAEYFAYSFDRPSVLKQLYSTAERLPSAPHKVRVCVSLNGAVSLSAEPLSQISKPGPVRLAIARSAINSQSPFLFHKTTNRALYDNARADWPGFDDVILWNERGEITESCIANIVVERGGRLITPPIDCGLLPGVFRGHLLEHGLIEECVIRVDEVRSARNVFLINSVRKWMKADVVETHEKN